MKCKYPRIRITIPFRRVGGGGRDEDTLRIPKSGLEALVRALSHSNKTFLHLSTVDGRGMELGIAKLCWMHRVNLKHLQNHVTYYCAQHLSEHLARREQMPINTRKGWAHPMVSPLCKFKRLPSPRRARPLSCPGAAQGCTGGNRMCIHFPRAFTRGAHLRLGARQGGGTAWFAGRSQGVCVTLASVFCSQKYLSLNKKLQGHMK